MGNTAVRLSWSLAESVHPRSRGEHSSRNSSATTSSGSSPLMWGTPSEQRPSSDLLRFIPAHVGNTSGFRRRPCGTPVHPRSRGEHYLESAGTTMLSGSSPLTWGTPQTRGIPPDSRRFIPAHVGNTRVPRFPFVCLAVHPRSRGEHVKPPLQQALPVGSSPLTWGTHRLPSGRAALHRFIPAHVGNT